MIKTLPVMSIKDLIILPNQEIKVELTNEISRQVTMISGKYYDGELLIVCPKDSLEEIPDVSDLPLVGVVAKINSKIELPNDHLRIKVIGKKRVKVKKYFNDNKNQDILKCNYEDLKLPEANEAEEIALMRKLKELLKLYIKKNATMPNTILASLKNVKTLDTLTDIIAAFIPISFEKKLIFMEELDPLVRARNLLDILNIEIEILKIEDSLNESLQKSIDDGQREFLLREKVKEIEKELGEENSNFEALEWRKKLEKLNIDVKTKVKIVREIAKFEKMNDLSPDASFLRNYLENFFALPWQNFTTDINDLVSVSNTLNKSHYGMDEVKERVIEYVASKKRNPNLRSPIICLVGPPGVGKTTIAMSIAKSLDKEFYKISVAGLNDASELSGNRRTYIGSSPGKIIQAMIKCGVKNPVLLIDEVDKMTKDYKGDPASVLLDVLDYPQNTMFVDNFIEEPFDLSNVLFILTANDISKIPVELRDRLEIIELSSYTTYEKISLAKDYLLPEIYESYGITIDEVNICDGALASIIRNYTKEAGVRDLKRKLETLVRKVITSFIKAHRKLAISLEEKDLKKYLGVCLYDDNVLPKSNVSGLVNGLAWTSLGGAVLAIESCMYDGTGKIHTTGSLEKVINESIRVAHSYIKAHNKEFQINDYLFTNKDVHLHVLDGATPKDGPSAGIAMVTSLISLYSNKCINNDVAMTGEITLRGDILAVGGIKEKLIGAFNAGIHTVYLPKQNKKDLKKVPDYVLDNLKIVLVSNYKEIYKDLFGNV